MAGGRVELIMALTGESQLTAALATAQTDLDAFIGRAKDSAASTKTAFRGIGDEVKQTGLSVTDVATGFLAIKSAAQSALAIVQQLDAHIVAGEIAKNVDVVFRAVTRNADAALERLQRAGRFEFDDTTLQSMANKWRLLGVEAGDAASIIELGTKVAQVTMGDASQATDAFFNAVAKGRDGALRSMGIVVDLKGATAAYAASVGKTTAELNQHELQQARIAALNQEVARTLEGIPLDQVTNRVGQAKRAWDNFKSNLEVKAFELLADAIDGVDGFMGALSGTAGDARITFADLSVETIGLMQKIEALGAKSGAAGEEMNFLVKQALGLTAALKTQRVAQSDAELEQHTAALRQRERATFASDMAALQHEAAEAALRDIELREAAAVKMTRSQRAQLDLDKAHAQILRDVTAGKISDAEAEHQRTVAMLRHEAALAQRGAGRPGDPTKEWARFAREAASETSASLRSMAKAMAETTAQMERDLADLSTRQAAAQNAARELALESQSIHLDDLGRLRLQHQDRLSRVLEQQAIDEIDRQRIRDEADLERVRFQQDEQAILLERDAEARQEHARRVQEGIDALERFADVAERNNYGGLATGTKLLGAFAAAQDALVKGTPGAISALGQRAAGLIRNKKAEAGTLALFEGAEAIRAYANLDFWGGTMHMAAAAGYGAMAGSGGGSSVPAGGGAAGAGSHQSASRAPVSQSQGATIGGGATMNLYMNGGYYFGAKDDAGAEVGRMLHRAFPTGFQNLGAGQ
ncbi:MAG: hypothetical protein AMXMBFR77_27970 [Phycisphaerales bacterium]